MTSGLVAAAVAVVVGVPVLRGEGGGGGAFATWGPNPVELQGGQRAAVVAVCVRLQGGDENGDLQLQARPRPAVLVAESRGGWNYVVYRAAAIDGAELEGTCLVPDDLVENPSAGRSGFFGGLDPAEDVPEVVVPAGSVTEDEFAAGAVGDALFVYVSGRAGLDVAEIEVLAPSGRTIEASLQNGRWAAWWPAGEASATNIDLREAPRYRVTRRDGTITSEVTQAS